MAVNDMRPFRRVNEELISGVEKVARLVPPSTSGYKVIVDQLTEIRNIATYWHSVSPPADISEQLAQQILPTESLVKKCQYNLVLLEGMLKRVTSAPTKCLDVISSIHDKLSSRRHQVVDLLMGRRQGGNDMDVDEEHKGQSQLYSRTLEIKTNHTTAIPSPSSGLGNGLRPQSLYNPSPPRTPVPPSPRSRARASRVGGMRLHAMPAMSPREPAKKHHREVQHDVRKRVKVVGSPTHFSTPSPPPSSSSAPLDSSGTPQRVILKHHHRRRRDATSPQRNTKHVRVASPQHTSQGWMTSMHSPSSRSFARSASSGSLSGAFPLSPSSVSVAAHVASSMVTASAVRLARSASDTSVDIDGDALMS